MNEKEASPPQAESAIAAFKAFHDWVKRCTSERKKAADLAFEVAKAERERTLMRFALAEKLVLRGASKTAAMDGARIDPAYIKASEEIDQLTNRWEHAYAEAVGSQNGISVALAQLAYQQGPERAKVELKAIRAFLEQRVRGLSPSDAVLEAGE